MYLGISREFDRILSRIFLSVSNKFLTPCFMKKFVKYIEMLSTFLSLFFAKFAHGQVCTVKYLLHLSQTSDLFRQIYCLLKYSNQIFC